MEFNKLDTLTKLKLAADLSECVVSGQQHVFNPNYYHGTPDTTRNKNTSERFNKLCAHGITSLSLYHGDSSPLTLYKKGDGTHLNPPGSSLLTSVSFVERSEGVVMSFNSDMRTEEVSSIGLSNGSVSGTILIGDDIREALKRAINFLDIFTLDTSTKANDCADLVIALLSGLDKAETLPTDVIALVSKSGSKTQVFSAICRLINGYEPHNNQHDLDEDEEVPNSPPVIIRNVSPSRFDVIYNHPSNYSLKVQYVETVGEPVGTICVRCAFNGKSEGIVLHEIDIPLESDIYEFVDSIIDSIAVSKLNAELGEHIAVLADYVTTQLADCKPFIEGAVERYSTMVHVRPNLYNWRPNY